MTSRLLAYLALTLTAALWGIGSVVIKYSLSFVTPVAFLFFRFAIVCMIFLPLFISEIRHKKIKLNDIPRLSVLGFMATTLSLCLIFWGINMSTALEAGLLVSITPIFIMVGGALFLSETIGRRQKIGAGLALFGSIVSVSEPLVSSGLKTFTNLKGNLLIFAYVLVWSAYSILARKYEHHSRHSAVVLTSFSFLVGLVTITPLFIIERMTQHQPLLFLNLQALPGILYMALFGSCIAYFTYNWGYKMIPASRATIFAYLEPLFTLPLAILWLGETISIWFAAGAVLITAGVVLTQFPKRK